MSINETTSQASQHFSQEHNENKIIPIRDLVFQNDFELFRTYRKFPFLFVTHLLLLIVSTYIIIVHSEALDDLVYHNRAVQSAFFFHQDTSAPAKEYKKKAYISSLPNFLSHIDNVISTIYNVNTSLTFNISFDKFNDLKIDVDYLDYDLDKKQIFNFDGHINNATHNPIRSIGSIKEIKRWLNTIKNIVIELNYNCTIGLHYYQVVTLELKYDFKSRGIIVYDVNIIYSLQGFILDFKFSDINVILIIVLIVLAICEVVIIVRKVYFNLKVLMIIKIKLSDDNKSKLKRLSFGITDKNEDTEDLNNDEELIDFLGPKSNKKKSKWSQLKLKDKMKFIPKWLCFFILGDLFHLMSGVTYLSSNAFTPQNVVFFGFSSLLSWVALGYYFQGHFKYDYVYDTLVYSFGTYSKLLVVFATLFSGFALAHLTLFPSSEHWFNGGYNTFETLGAEVFADSYLLVWSSTIEKYALRTVFLALVIYVIFTGCHLRVMFVMTEEAFQHVLLKKKFDWNKKKKISVEDYINHEIALNEEEDEANGDNNYFMDDIWIKAIVDKDDINQILNFDVTKLNSSLLYNVEQIKEFFHKKAKKIKKRNISTTIINDIFNYDFEKDLLGLSEGVGKTETTMMYETHRGIEEVFNKIKRYLLEITKNGKKRGMFSEIEKKKKEIILDKMQTHLSNIKLLLN